MLALGQRWSWLHYCEYHILSLHHTGLDWVQDPPSVPQERRECHGGEQDQSVLGQSSLSDPQFLWCCHRVNVLSPNMER